MAYNWAFETRDVPEGEHYVLLTNRSITYDDGSVDNRGGPSYSTHKSLEYRFFLTKTELDEHVKSNIDTLKRDGFKILDVKPLTVKVTVEVEVS